MYEKSINHGCSDNYCVFGHVGMGTNGGCGCLKNLPTDKRRELKSKIESLRSERDDLLAEISRLKEDYGLQDGCPYCGGKKLLNSDEWMYEHKKDCEFLARILKDKERER